MTNPDRFRGPNVQPGDRVTSEKDGAIYTDTISSVTYTSGESEIWAEPTWWQHLARHHRLRWIVPPRWRQPMKPIRPSKPASVTVTVGEDDPMKRAMAMNAKALEVIERLGR